jgi:hypothetical protein
MTHPITPPPELLQQWYDQAKKDPCGPINWVAVCAAQWAADQELEACCKVICNSATNFSATAHLEAQRRSDKLRAARRPKPPSLKEQALDSLRKIEDNNATYLDADIIRRALEALPE